MGVPQYVGQHTTGKKKKKNALESVENMATHAQYIVDCLHILSSYKG